jgi:UDPglucose--hexose-1-phosphate uridylyltransferase
MSELRRDPLLDRWVIIAEERQLRPQDAPSSAEYELPTVDADSDPFAAGNERYTPAEVYAIRPNGEPNSPGWTVRAIPNKYPILRVEGDLDPRGYGVYDKLEGIGAHEVVIETPSDLQLRDLPLSQIYDVLNTFRLRMEDLTRDKRFAYVMVFKNHGRSAGATQSHSHSQIVALPIMPVRVREQLTALQQHWQLKRRSLFQDIIDQELRQRERVVFENESMLVICPFASSFPFELQILPKRQSADFRQASVEELRDLAEALKASLLKWKGALGEVAYNMMLHTAPNDTRQGSIYQEFPLIDTYYFWHIELLPRLTKTAGFEWGTGHYINPVLPERAAEYLREIEVELS